MELTRIMEKMGTDEFYDFTPPLSSLGLAYVKRNDKITVALRMYDFSHFIL